MKLVVGDKIFCKIKSRVNFTITKIFPMNRNRFNCEVKWYDNHVMHTTLDGIIAYLKYNDDQILIKSKTVQFNKQLKKLIKEKS